MLLYDDEEPDLNPARTVTLRAPSFRRRPCDAAPAKPVVRPNDEAPRRPQTEAEIAAHNAAVMAANERERQKKAGWLLPGETPVKGRPRVR